jgi:uncharacterized repeat protein (TIGR01451 family)
MKKWSLASLLTLIVFSVTAFFSPLVGAQDEQGLSLTKTADTTAASLGDTITYTYLIENTDNVTISSLELIDSELDVITLPTTTLEAGATCNVTAQHTVLISDYESGFVLENLATIKGIRPDGSTAIAEAETSVELLEYAATLTLEKVADPASVSPHETIKYTYTVTNTGNVTISDLSLVDSNLGTITLSPTSLEPGESISAEYDYEVTVADLPGPIVNAATVTGEDPLGNEVSYTTEPVSVSLTVNKRIMTRAEILKMSGVPGKGIENAPGLQKQFNERSRAAERAGKKDKDKEKGNNGKNGK